MKSRRLHSPRAIRLVSLTLCFSLTVSAVLVPLSPSVAAEISNGTALRQADRSTTWQSHSSFGRAPNFALETWNHALTLLGWSPQENDGMPTRPPVPAPQEPKSPPTRSEKESRVFSIQISLDAESWIPSKQRFVAGAVPLDKDGNAIHGLPVEWTTSDKQIIFITGDAKAVAGRPGAARLTAQA